MLVADNTTSPVAAPSRPAMNDKMKACFTPHVLMHSLFGLGLGLLLATWFDGLRQWWLAVIVMAVAVALDASRKS